MRLIHRLMKLEVKQQPKNSTCYSIDWFYGIESKPVPLIRNLSLADFYTSKPNRLVNEVSFVKN